MKAVLFNLQGGLYMLNLLDSYVGGFPLLIVGVIELIVVIYVYGFSFSNSDTEKYPRRLLRGEVLRTDNAFFNFIFP